MKPMSAPQPNCADCGAQSVSIILDDIHLCDRCYDARIEASTGGHPLPEPPPEMIAGPDGRLHRIAYRVWRSPGGVVVEAEEDGEPFDGFYAEVVGAHDSDPAALVERARAAIRRRIGRQELRRAPGGDHWIISDDDVHGRLVWDQDLEPYDVVVDVQRLTWEEFGQALEPFEGWEFRLS